MKESFRVPVLALAAALLCLLGTPPACSASASANASKVPRIPSREEREALRKIAAPASTAPASPGAPMGLVDLQEDVDVIHYFLDLEFVPSPIVGQNGSVSGSVTIRAASLVDGLGHLVLDFRSNMTVTSVTRGSISLAFTHASDVLDILLDAPFGRGHELEVEVTYAGQPIPRGFGSIRWKKYNSSGWGQMVATLSEPQGARDWWPCKDRPDDKATVEEWWTVPSSWTATGNGVLQGTDLLFNRVRYRWKATRPLTTYLVSIAATSYASFSHTYTPIAGGSMPVVYYVYPEDLAEAQVSFTATVSMIEFFAQKFGEYPFVEDQYGMSAFPFGGAMEHTTNSSYGYTLIDGGHTYDWIIAHELAHQWWGDSLSPSTWQDIWLNEGFASYSEALWWEHLNGPTGYRAYMNSMYSPSFSGPVYANPIWFGSTVYDKGAWVQHMLRGVMGDGAFFAGLADWYDAHKDGVVDTAAYQTQMEAQYGAPLDWFFDEWVYGINSPRYEWGFTTADLGGGNHRVYVRILQVQTDAPVFRMPVRLTVVGGSGSEVRTVWNEAVDQVFALDVTEAPLDVLFDEHDWILAAQTTEVALADLDADGVPDLVDNCPGASNASQTDTDTDAAGDACDGDDDGDLLADGADCAPLDGTAGQPAEVDLLAIALGAGATADLSWDPVSLADSYDVVRGLLSSLESGDAGLCLASVPGPSHSDGDTPTAGDGFWYLVRGHDEGCGGAGPLGYDSLGVPRPSPCP